MKIEKFQIIILVLGVVLIVSLTGNIGIWQKNNKIFGNPFTSSVGSLVVKPVLAEEIYPLFLCPCCGQPLDPKKICCEMAKEMVDYIDSLVQTKDTKDDVIFSFVKKYGLNSFTNKNKAEEFREKLIATAPAERPQIVIRPETFDFRDVSQKGGNVFTYFELKNEGKSDLIIDRLETSCGCTFVAISFGGKESPYFTMPGHGYENPKWDGVTIPAGATAQLKVMYDPNVHKDFRGFAIREIYVFSNDPVDFEKKVRVELNQVD